MVGAGKDIQDRQGYVNRRLYCGNNMERYAESDTKRCDADIQTGTERNILQPKRSNGNFFVLLSGVFLCNYVCALSGVCGDFSTDALPFFYGLPFELLSLPPLFRFLSLCHCFRREVSQRIGPSALRARLVLAPPLLPS